MVLHPNRVVLLLAACVHLYQNPSLTRTSSQTLPLAPVGFQHSALVLGQSRGSRQGGSILEEKPARGSASGKSHVFLSPLDSRTPLYITAVRE